MVQVCAHELVRGASQGCGGSRMCNVELAGALQEAFCSHCGVRSAAMICASEGLVWDFKGV